MAILRIHGRGNVLPTIQQHLPPLVLPLSAHVLHSPPCGLHRNRLAHCHLILPACLLLLHVQPLLLQPLPRYYHRDGDRDNDLLFAPDIPEARVQELPSLVVLRDGGLRSGPHTSQVTPLWDRSPGGPADDHLRGSDGGSVWVGGFDLCDKSPREMEAWVFRSRWTESPAVSCAGGGCCVYSLPGWACILELAGLEWLLAAAGCNR
ncbi:unnamed protein product [Linum tenue]|nr:unnamed protein product [Linum tenue]